MNTRTLITASALLALGVAAAFADTAPYGGMQNRSIKALSPQQLEDLNEGRGMGLALAAELNRYPGPAHVLELAPKLGLSPAVEAETRSLFQAMKQEAAALGRQIIDREAALERAFSTGAVDDAGLRRSLGEIATLQGELRYTHLKYHLAMRALLTSEQVASYDALRGYDRTQGPTHGGGAPGHRHRP
jgi:hypothetical protein